METDRNGLAAGRHRRSGRPRDVRVAVAPPDVHWRWSLSAALFAGLAIALLLGNAIGLIQG
ncbi:hypothetical protein ASE63_09465 [Bosea sp. Root381]|uniref:hypothetical protein n=1 Tax=Bosea sp. Root381 TaxID=1736524 RepID=UPI0006F2A36B|nr:hypothetical protein [Bosea sp. Root381]KRE00290.1 hypothetical protein ASE63_09465 [Bosea sp. Root381]